MCAYPTPFKLFVECPFLLGNPSCVKRLPDLQVATQETESIRAMCGARQRPQEAPKSPRVKKLCKAASYETVEFCEEMAEAFGHCAHGP